MDVVISPTRRIASTGGPVTSYSVTSFPNLRTSDARNLPNLTASLNASTTAAEKSSLLLQQIYRIESLLQESLAIDPEADIADDSLFFDQDRDAIELVLEDRAKAAKKTQERLERGLQESHGAHVELYHIVEDIIDQHDHISIEIDRVVKDSLMLSEGIMHRNEETMKNNKRREQDLVSNVAAIEREAIERHERTRSSRMQSKITQTSKFQDRSNKPTGTAATTENSPGMDDKGTSTDPMMWTGSNAGVMHNGQVSTHSPTGSSSKQAQQQGRSTANALSNSAAMSPNNSSSAASSSAAMNSSSKQNTSGSPHGQKEDNRMDRSNAQPQTTNYRSAGANRGAGSNNPREKSPIADGTKRDDRSRVTPMATSKTVLLSPPNPLSPPVAAFNEQHASHGNKMHSPEHSNRESMDGSVEDDLRPSSVPTYLLARQPQSFSHQRDNSLHLPPHSQARHHSPSHAEDPGPTSQQEETLSTAPGESSQGIVRAQRRLREHKVRSPSAAQGDTTVAHHDNRAADDEEDPETVLKNQVKSLRGMLKRERDKNRDIMAAFRKMRDKVRTVEREMVRIRRLLPNVTAAMSAEEFEKDIEQATNPQEQAGAQLSPQTASPLNSNSAPSAFAGFMPNRSGVPSLQSRSQTTNVAAFGVGNGVLLEMAGGVKLTTGSYSFKKDMDKKKKEMREQTIAGLPTLLGMKEKELKSTPMWSMLKQVTKQT